MSWWSRDNDMMGDIPGDIIKEMLDNVVEFSEEHERYKPTFEEILSNIKLVINQNGFQLLENGKNISIRKIIVRLENSLEIESREVESNELFNFELAPIVHQKLSELIEPYQVRFERKPRLREVLIALDFIIGGKPEKYFAIEQGNEVQNIIAELESGTTISVWQSSEIEIDSPSEMEVESLKPESEELISSQPESDLDSSWRDIGYVDLSNGKKYNDVVNREATSLLKENFKKIAQSYYDRNENLPTLKIFFDYVASALLNYQNKLCSFDERNEAFQKLVMVIEDQPDLISDGGGIPANDPFVKEYTEAFTSLSRSYELKWQRKPRIREVLATFDMANDAILEIVCDIDSDIYIEETVVK